MKKQFVCFYYGALWRGQFIVLNFRLAVSAFEVVLKLSLFAAPLSATNVVAVAVSTNALNISWERPERVDLFEIKIQSLSDVSNKILKNITKHNTTVIIDGLMTGTLYNITIRVLSAGIFSLPSPNVITPTCKCCALSALN